VDHFSNGTGKSDPTKLFSEYSRRKPPTAPEDCGVSESTRTVVIVG